MGISHPSATTTARPIMTPLLLLAVCSGMTSGLPLAQRQNCFGSQCNQNNGGGSGFGGFQGFGGGASQNCFGSQCNQNNFGKKKREAQFQNCVGSQCNQNNGGGSGFGGFQGFGGGASQN